MAENVSQTEYDVTAYRNVLDQLRTLEGRTGSLYNALRYQLADPKYITSTFRRSGWAMKNRGGKSERRWTEIVGPAIGLGNLKFGQWPSNTAPSLHVTDISRIESFRKKVKPNFHVTPRSLQSRVYDVLSILRSLEWELNRLRIQMPFDLRQLAAQLDRYASDFTRAEGTASRSRGKGGGRQTITIPNAISMFQVFEQIKKLNKTWLPKMLARIRKRIEDAKLAEKVAEENMRRESEATKKKKLEPTASPAPGKVAVDKAQEQAQIAAQVKAALQKAKQENEAEITAMAKEQGDSPGTGNGAAVAGILALLAIAGAG